jgi:hypothetical protein
MTTKNLPLVSIILPAFNADAFLRLAVQSIFAQTYTHWHSWRGIPLAHPSWRGRYFLLLKIALTQTAFKTMHVLPNTGKRILTKLKGSQ